MMEKNKKIVKKKIVEKKHAKINFNLYIFFRHLNLYAAFTIKCQKFSFALYFRTHYKCDCLFGGDFMFVCVYIYCVYSLVNGVSPTDFISNNKNSQKKFFLTVRASLAFLCFFFVLSTPHFSKNCYKLFLIAIQHLFDT